jgi:hypothetical protein
MNKRHGRCPECHSPIIKMNQYGFRNGQVDSSMILRKFLWCGYCQKELGEAAMQTYLKEEDDSSDGDDSDDDMDSDCLPKFAG